MTDTISSSSRPLLLLFYLSPPPRTPQGIFEGGADDSDDDDSDDDEEEAKEKKEGTATSDVSKPPLTLKNLKAKYLATEEHFPGKNSYAEYLQEEDPDLVGDANVLVVYSEDCLLETLIKALDNHCEELQMDKERTFFWLKDLACRATEINGKMNGAFLSFRGASEIFIPILTLFVIYGIHR